MLIKYLQEFQYYKSPFYINCILNLFTYYNRRKIVSISVAINFFVFW